MDEELNFPNPVLRTDLPVKKPRWPKVLAAMAVLGVLSVIFLPQILHTRIGKRIIRARLEGRYAAEIGFQDFSTSWFGGTTAGQFWIKTSDGRVIGFNSLQCDASLWKLLRSNYALGDCTIDGLIVDYVLDSGDDAHRDTYERLTGLLPRPAGAPPADLARLSGKVSLTNAQLNFYRGKTDPGTLRASYQSIKFANISGQFDIPSLDKPWTYSLRGTTGITGLERDQTFESQGKLCLGEAGKLLPARISVDATFSGLGVPTEVVPMFLPIIAFEDARASFGTTFDRLNLSLKGTAGVLQLEVIEAAGPHVQAHLQPTIDLNTAPATVMVKSKNPADNLIDASLPTGPTLRAMGAINPFAPYTTGGTAVLRIESLEMPLSRFWNLGTVKAEVELHDAKLSPRVDLSGSESSAGLPAQLALLTGDMSRTLTLQPMPLKFSLDNGNITLTPVTLGVGAAQVTLSGTSTVEGVLRMKLGVKSDPLLAAVPEFAKEDGVSLEVPLGGTADAPKLNFDSALRTLPSEPGRKMKDWIARQFAAMQAREADESQRANDRKIQQLLKGMVQDDSKSP